MESISLYRHTHVLRYSNNNGLKKIRKGGSVGLFFSLKIVGENITSFTDFCTFSNIFFSKSKKNLLGRSVLLGMVGLTETNICLF